MVAWTRITVGGQPVLDHAQILRELSHHPKWARDLGVLRCPAGKDPGGVTLLMNAAKFAALDLSAELPIVWTYSEGSANSATTTKTFIGYRVARAFDALAIVNSPVVVELVDERQQFRFSATSKRFNVRQPMGDEWVTDTLNSGTPYTWDQVLAQLAGDVPGLTAPTLAAAPTSTPEDLVFDGVSAWEAICEVVERAGHGIAFDPVAGTVSTFKYGETQSGLSSQVSGLETRKRKSRDNAYRAAASANVPEKVRVFFHWQPGSADNFLPEEPHSIDVASSVTGAIAGTVLPSWATVLAETPNAGTGSDPVNATDLQTEAERIAAAEVARLKREAQPSLRRFMGLHEIAVGSEVSEVIWRTDRGSTTTEIRLGGKPLFFAGGQYLDRIPPSWFAPGVLIAKSPTGGIGARSGDTPGSATVDIQRISDAGTLVDATDAAGATITKVAYNLSGGAVAGSTASVPVYLQIVPERFGKHLVNYEDCSGV